MFLQSTEEMEPKHINHDKGDGSQHDLEDKKHQHEDSKVQYDSNRDYAKTSSEELPDESFLKEVENPNVDIATEILDFVMNTHEENDESHPDFNQQHYVDHHKDNNQKKVDKHEYNSYSEYNDEDLYTPQHNEADQYEKTNGE